MTALDVVTFGEAMAMFVATAPGDLAEVETFTRRMAGAETNVAVGLARLGLRVGWISRLGDDSFARFIRATLAREGVDCGAVATDPAHPTGFQLKSRAMNGADPCVEYCRRGSAASLLSLADWNAGYALGARHLHATGVAAALSPSSYEFSSHMIAEMRRAGRTVSFDPNLRPVLWPSREVMVDKLNALAVQANWVLPGLAEGRILTGLEHAEDIAAYYIDRGVELVVIKLGPAGAYWRTADASGAVAAVRVDTVVDTVGAGDGFAAGVISALIEGESIPDAVMRGNRVGAFAIQVIGDMDGLPTRAELGLPLAA